MDTRSKTSSIILFTFLTTILLFHKANAFNITKVLSPYPEFATFNKYLTDTNLASEINARQTITVLAVENTTLAALAGQPPDIIKKILSVHVILDYYDITKLQRLTNGTLTMATLFQTTGTAKGQQGFVNITRLSTDSIAFGSAVPGTRSVSNLVKSVASQPYNLSVLHVSNAIIPPGIGVEVPTGGPSQAPTPAPGIAAPPVTARAPSPAYAEVPAKALTPNAAPWAPPVPVITPAANAPATDGPIPDGPVADGPSTVAAAGPSTEVADDQRPPDSGGMVLGVGLGGGVCALVISSLYLGSRI